MSTRQEPRPSEIRETLLRQHEAIRRLAAIVERAAGDADRNDERFFAAVHDLAAAVEGHNQFEERALRPLLANLDAWGPERVTTMAHKHLLEHGSLTRALGAAASRTLDPAARVRVARAAIRDLLDHMNREERQLLSPNVLRDDIITVDQSSS